MKVGDIVINPKNPSDYSCVIIAIENRKNGKGYFILSPFTKSGWPSKNNRLWQWYNLVSLSKMKQSKKYPRLLICPKCEVSNKLLNAPLRWPSIYENKYQCKKCKEIFKSEQAINCSKECYEHPATNPVMIP